MTHVFQYKARIERRLAELQDYAPYNCNNLMLYLFEVSCDYLTNKKLPLDEYHISRSMDCMLERIVKIAKEGSGTGRLRINLDPTNEPRDFQERFQGRKR